ncbi:unnamed protein product [Calicophoron daubneyi]|uniref:C2H2-type domain-containing protein n=1 Tax=Calicophoron daubneyi TaxID=300641 RepID=A0AAV2TLS1_CALDB
MEYNPRYEIEAARCGFRGPLLHGSRCLESEACTTRNDSLRFAAWYEQNKSVAPPSFLPPSESSNWTGAQAVGSPVPRPILPVCTNFPYIRPLMTAGNSKTGGLLAGELGSQLQQIPFLPIGTMPPPPEILLAALRAMDGKPAVDSPSETNSSFELNIGRNGEPASTRATQTSRCATRHAPIRQHQSNSYKLKSVPSYDADGWCQLASLLAKALQTPHGNVSNQDACSSSMLNTRPSGSESVDSPSSRNQAEHCGNLHLTNDSEQGRSRMLQSSDNSGQLNYPNGEPDPRIEVRFSPEFQRTCVFCKLTIEEGVCFGPFCVPKVDQYHKGEPTDLSNESNVNNKTGDVSMDLNKSFTQAWDWMTHVRSTANRITDPKLHGSEVNSSPNLAVFRTDLEKCGQPRPGGNLAKDVFGEGLTTPPNHRGSDLEAIFFRSLRVINRGEELLIELDPFGNGDLQLPPRNVGRSNYHYSDSTKTPCSFQDCSVMKSTLEDCQWSNILPTFPFSAHNVRLFHVLQTWMSTSKQGNLSNVDSQSKRLSTTYQSPSGSAPLRSNALNRKGVARKAESGPLNTSQMSQERACSITGQSKHINTRTDFTSTGNRPSPFTGSYPVAHQKELNDRFQSSDSSTDSPKRQLRPAHLVEPEATGEGYSCKYCGKMFAYQYYRDKHLKYTRCVDQGNRKFPCSLCSRSFEKRDRLRIHVLHVHEKHRPHKCHLCEKSFSQSSSLNKHLRCKYCWKPFASHAAHDSHVRRTHSGLVKTTCEPVSARPCETDNAEGVLHEDPNKSANYGGQWNFDVSSWCRSNSQLITAAHSLSSEPKPERFN